MPSPSPRQEPVPTKRNPKYQPSPAVLRGGGVPAQRVELAVEVGGLGLLAARLLVEGAQPALSLRRAALGLLPAAGCGGMGGGRAWGAGRGQASS